MINMMKIAAMKSRRDDILLTVGEATAQPTYRRLPSLPSPAGTALVMVCDGGSVVPAGLMEVGDIFRRLKPPVNKMSSLRDWQNTITKITVQTELIINN
jgi:hypothetical protein